MQTITELPSPPDTARLRALALRDLQAGIGDVALWGRLGTRDLARRYRRTLLGPLWESARAGMFVMALGLVGSRLTPGSGVLYVPYVAAGMVVWTFLLEATMMDAEILLLDEALVTIDEVLDHRDSTGLTAPS